MRRGWDRDQRRPGRASRKVWTRDAVHEAVRAWYSEHGRLPTHPDWVRAEPRRPSARTLQRMGGFDIVIADALGIDLEDVPYEQLRRPDRPEAVRWTPEAMIDALIAYHDRLGSWPTGRWWERAARDHPARRSVERNFGSWDRAVLAAQIELRSRRRRRLAVPARPRR